MVLKIQLNGKKQTITGVGTPPVVFIDGVKKKLPKGITFINGQKKVLWDVNSLKIDYISGIYNVLNDTAVNAIFADTKKIILSNMRGVQSYNVYTVDIQNKSTPKLLSKVALGDVSCYSPIDSTDDTMVYYAVSGESKGQQLNVNVATGEITASNVYNNASGRWGNSTGGLIGTNMWLGASNYIDEVGLIAYTNNVRGDLVYKLRSGSTSLGGASLPNYAKLSSTSYLVCTGGLNTTKSISVVNADGLEQRVLDVYYENMLVDTDKILCAGSSGIRIMNKQYETLYDRSVGTGRRGYVLGKIRDYFYFLDAPVPAKDVSDLNVYLHICNATDGSLFETVQLDLIAKASTQTYGKDLIHTIPVISKTGCLSFVFYPSVVAGSESETKLVLIQGY